MYGQAGGEGILCKSYRQRLHSARLSSTARRASSSSTSIVTRRCRKETLNAGQRPSLSRRGPWSYRGRCSPYVFRVTAGDSLIHGSTRRASAASGSTLLASCATNSFANTDRATPLIANVKPSSRPAQVTVQQGPSRIRSECVRSSWYVPLKEAAARHSGKLHLLVSSLVDLKHHNLDASVSPQPELNCPRCTTQPFVLAAVQGMNEAHMEREAVMRRRPKETSFESATLMLNGQGTPREAKGHKVRIVSLTVVFLPSLAVRVPYHSRV